MQRRRAVSRKQNRRVHALITLIFCIAVFILVCAGCFLLVKTDGTITNKPNQSQGDSSSTAPDGADSTTDGGDSQQEQPTMTEEEQRIADATATASANCTKDAPQVVDPALWDERGKALMEQLAADEFYQSEGLKYSAKDGCPYMIAVNRAASTVTVLALDDEGNYTKPYMAMVCSGGADTPLGFFATPVNYDWRLLAGQQAIPIQLGGGRFNQNYLDYYSIRAVDALEAGRNAFSCMDTWSNSPLWYTSGEAVSGVLSSLSISPSVSESRVTSGVSSVPAASSGAAEASPSIRSMSP